ncbi:MAG: hypothetical protein HYX34_03565 [Actinobacteria bacterium]|nr:hypothetical protein [Actinomycetota bacterium]
MDPTIPVPRPRRRLRAAALSLLALVATAAGLAALGAARAPASAGMACDKTFTGATNNLWEDSSNWAPTGVPTSSEGACIPSGTAAIVQTSRDVGGVDVASGATLLITGNGSYGNARLNLTGTGSTNAGTIELSSTGGGFAASLAGADLANSGALLATAGTGGQRALDVALNNTGTVSIGAPTTTTATLVNAGTWTVSSGYSLSASGSAQLTNKPAATFTVDGSAYFGSGSTFRFEGGTLPSGDPVLDQASLTFAAGATSGTGTGFQIWRTTSLTGDVPAKVTVTVLGNGSVGNAALNVAAALTNRGTIDLSASGGGYSSVLQGSAITNRGTISTSAGSAGARTLAAPISNLATVSIGTNTVETGNASNSGSWTIASPYTQTMGGAATFANNPFGSLKVDGAMTVPSGTTFRFNGGTLPTGDPVIDEGTLSFAPSATAGAGTGFETWRNVSLAGTVPANVLVSVVGNGSTGSAQLSAAAAWTNKGTVTLTSTGGGYAATLTGAGVTNQGTIRTAPGAGGPRYISAALSNTSAGTVQLDAGTSITANASNAGTWNVGTTGGATLSGTATFTNAVGGTLTIDGSMYLGGGTTFAFSGGVLPTGDPVLDQAALVFGAGASTSGSGTGFIAWRSVSMDGTVPANVLVSVVGNGSTGNAALSATAPLTNAGTIDLTSTGGGYAASLTGAAVTNQGTISTSVGAGGPRYLNVPLVNAGTVAIGFPTTVSAAVEHRNDGAWSVASGASLGYASTSGSTFVSGPGSTLTVDGSMQLRDGTTFRVAGGSIPAGDPVLDQAALSIDAGATAGAGSGLEIWRSVPLTGDIPAGLTLTVTGNPSVGNASLTATAPLTNAGGIVLSSSGGGWSATLDGSAIVNTGSITTLAGAGGNRYLNAALTNQGSISAGPSTVVSGVADVNKGAFEVAAGGSLVFQSGASLRQEAGTFTVNGTSRFASGATFTYAGGTLPAGDPTIQDANLVFAGNPPALPDDQSGVVVVGTSTLTGKVPSRFKVTVQGNGSWGNATLVSTTAVTSYGRIVLTSVGGGWGATLDMPALVNRGTLTVWAGAGGPRRLTGDLANWRTVDLGLGVVTLNVGGSYSTAGASALVRLRVAGNGNAARIAVAGTASLGGKLTILNGYSPAAGDTATLVTGSSVTGAFSSVAGLDAPGPTVWSVQYGANDVRIAAA